MRLINLITEKGDSIIGPGKHRAERGIKKSNISVDEGYIYEDIAKKQTETRKMTLGLISF